jgi:hypothetical protein
MNDAYMTAWYLWRNQNCRACLPTDKKSDGRCTKQNRLFRHLPLSGLIIKILLISLIKYLSGMEPVDITIESSDTTHATMETAECKEKG